MESPKVGDYVALYVKIKTQAKSVTPLAELSEIMDPNQYQAGIMHLAHNTSSNYDRDIKKLVAWQDRGVMSVVMLTALLVEETKLINPLRFYGLTPCLRVNDESYLEALSLLDSKLKNYE